MAADNVSRSGQDAGAEDGADEKHDEKQCEDRSGLGVIC